MTWRVYWWLRVALSAGIALTAMAAIVLGMREIWPDWLATGLTIALGGMSACMAPKSRLPRLMRENKRSAEQIRQPV